jgi:hypothetical protein
MNLLLDCVVPDPPTEIVDAAITDLLRAVGRQEMTQAVTILEEVVNSNSYWLRGYLLLVTVYQYVQNEEQAIITAEKGLAVCAIGLRLCNASKGIESLGQIKVLVVQRCIRTPVEQFRRYERIFRHQLATL